MSEKLYKLFHVWDYYEPGQFVEPHDYFNTLNDWESYVCGLRILGVENKMEHIAAMKTLPTKETAQPHRLMDRIFEKLHRPLRWIQFRQFLLRHYHSVKPDIVLFHFGTTAANLSQILSSMSAVKCVIFYGVDASAVLKKRSWLRKYKKIFSQVDQLIVLSEVVKDRFIRSGCSSEKIMVWNLPAGIENYPLTQKSTHDKAVKFICAARFVEKKGHPILLHAFCNVVKKMPQARLTLLGYGGQKSNILKMINDLNLQQNVTLIDTNMCPDFQKLYYAELVASDIFVLPSIEASDGDDEGGPALTLVCAQAAGLPVICTPFVGSEISVRDGENGLLCKMNDANSLSEKMIVLANDPKLRAELGVRGHKLVHQLFAKETQYNILKKKFQALIQAKTYS